MRRPQSFWEITTLNFSNLSYVVTVKSTVEISQNFVAFSEYMNFNNLFIQNFWQTIVRNSRLFTYLASKAVRFFASFKSSSSAVSEIFVRHRQIMQLVLMVFLLQQSPLSKLHCLLLTESSQIPSPFNCGSSQYSFRVLTKSKKIRLEFLCSFKTFLFLI